MHETGWCAVQITDIRRYLAVRVEAFPHREQDVVIQRGREWVHNHRRIHPHYPLSDEQWIEQTICSDLIKAVVWDRGDLIPDLGRALIKLTGFDVVVVQGTSDGVPTSLTELRVPGTALSVDFDTFSNDILYQPAGNIEAPLAPESPHS